MRAESEIEKGERMLALFACPGYSLLDDPGRVGAEPDLEAGDVKGDSDISMVAKMRCPGCGGELLDFRCACGAIFATKNGIPDLAPHLDAGEGLSPERLRAIARMERDHFWFAGRGRVVEHLLNGILQRKGPMAVLDVGCGTGYTAALLSGKGARVVGIDLGIESLAEAAISNPSSLFLRADASAIPFENETFDMVIMLDALEHIPDDRSALREIFRVLRSGGVLLMTLPAFPWLWSYRDEQAGHHRRYTRRNLEELLAAVGFELEEICYHQRVLLPLVACSRFFGRMRPALRDVEEAPAPAVNAALKALSVFEAGLPKYLPWPWGSSLAAVCRRDS